MRMLFFAVIGIMALGGTSAAAQIQPSSLTPYYISGKFNEGDLGWARSAFVKTAKARQQWREVVAWRDALRRSQTDVVVRELERQGYVAPHPGLHCFGEHACEWISQIVDLAALGLTDKLFQESLTSTNEKISAIQSVVETIGDQVFPAKIVSNEKAAVGFYVIDQAILRLREKPTSTLSLEGAKAAVVNVRLNMLSQTWQSRASVFLKDIVSKSGWPSDSENGRLYVDNLWLIAQHSDSDPALQALALQKMASMTGALTLQSAKEDYAYLQDRVLLSVGLPQRYGTQFECIKKIPTVARVEQPETLNDRRSKMGLMPINDYLAQISCQ